MNSLAAGLGPDADIGRGGRILASRWSIERLRRPTGPELVWLPYAKPEVVTFQCLACGERGYKQGAVRVLGRTFYLCAACASHQVYPLPDPPGPPGGLMRRLLLERAEGLPEAALRVCIDTGGRKPGALLDLGCELGWRVDVASCLPGWRAVGLDPGALPQWGREVLGAELRQGGAAALGELLPGSRFDVILCEGVLERSLDPAGLLRAALARAAGDARWLVAMPNAAALYSLDDPAPIRGLLPQDRILVPSRFGFIRLLRRAGFPAGAVEESAEWLRADRERRWPGRRPDEIAAEALLDTYLQRHPAGWTSDPSASVGLQVAALERAVARSDWTSGGVLLEQLSGALAAASEAARMDDVSDMAQLFRRAPLCSTSLLYHAGVQQFSARGASMQALMCFELASRLAVHVLALVPGAAKEADLFWAARFHAALVTRQLGDAERAVAVFKDISAGQARVPASPAWVARADAELAAALRPKAEARPASESAKTVRRARKPARARPLA